MSTSITAPKTGKLDLLKGCIVLSESFNKCMQLLDGSV